MLATQRLLDPVLLRDMPPGASKAPKACTNTPLAMALVSFMYRWKGLVIPGKASVGADVRSFFLGLQRPVVQPLSILMGYFPQQWQNRGVLPILRNLGSRGGSIPLLQGILTPVSLWWELEFLGQQRPKRQIGCSYLLLGHTPGRWLGGCRAEPFVLKLGI